MITLHYSKNNADFTTELRKSVKEYFKENNIQKYGNTEILIKTVFMLLIYLVPYFLMISGNMVSIPWVMTSWVIMALGMSGLGVATMHDANHGSFSKHKWVNKLFSKSLYLLGGYPPNWQYQHNTLHHGYTNIEGHDEDIGHEGVLRFSPHKPIKKIYKFQQIYAWFFYGLMTVSWITLKDFKRLKKYKDSGVVLSGNNNYRKMFVELLVSKVFYYAIFLVLPILLVPVAWYWILTGFLLMHFLSGLILSTIFQSAHVMPTSEYPLPDDQNNLDYNWAVHQLYTTADFSPKSKVFSWLLGGLNYQVEHHLFPNISHIHYRNIAEIVQKTAEKYHFPYHVNESFLEAIRQHYKMLKWLGRTKNINTAAANTFVANKASVNKVAAEYK